MDDKDLSFKKIFLLNLKMRWKNYLKVYGWKGVCFLLFYSFYFTVAFIGFWKIRNVIGSMKISFFIDFIFNAGVFVLVVLCMICMIRQHLFNYSCSLKHFISIWLGCLFFMCSLFGYFAFFCPGAYMGENITDNQFCEVIIPMWIPSFIGFIESQKD